MLNIDEVYRLSKYMYTYTFFHVNRYHSIHVHVLPNVTTSMYMYKRIYTTMYITHIIADFFLCDLVSMWNVRGGLPPEPA